MTDNNMMNDELILEPRSLAPSMSAIPPVKADEQFAEELAAIPDKLAFKIGEVADMLDVKAYVLRYWESEFKQLKPQKSRHNQRVYTRKDVEMLFMIKKLLYRDRFSIEGARSALKHMRKETKNVKAIQGSIDHIEDLRDQTQDVLVMINNLKSLFR